MLDKDWLIARARFMADNATTCDQGLRSLLRNCAAALEASQQEAPLTDTFVQPVPDKCDRIVWRNRYYQLPLAGKQEAQGGQVLENAARYVFLRDHFGPLDKIMLRKTSDGTVWVSGKALDTAVDSARLAATPKPQAEPPGFDECVASGQSCQYGPHGPAGEQQCRYCGSEPPKPQAEPADDFRTCEFCHCNTNAKMRRCCVNGAAADALAAQPKAVCRSDGRCQYAIDHGAEGIGHCPPGKCCMPQPERVALTPLTDEQHLELAKAMAQRLMSWRLPADFTPDCGISFKRESDYDHPEYGRTTYFPTGTNLFTHEQAVSMLLAILPADIGTQALEVTPEAVALWLRANGYRTEASRIERKHGIAA